METIVFKVEVFHNNSKVIKYFSTEEKKNNYLNKIENSKCFTGWAKVTPINVE